MLRLSEITKDYKVVDQYVPALKGITLNFRKSEFVSILGPSGCGKTTTLNIIGGLDKYTSGDLVINGTSTKNFTDHDWDVYRNHKIGFIFQSYNLIPHQTILGNVELALTISGINKKERIERAKKALDKVGLKGQYNKRPNQLSGGQCQRVAIARALVNEPAILLADEPTGALDTVTSVQIMDLIKEISKEKLVIMVTHNPELAEKYSTRIVRLLDGEVIEDSNPFSEEAEQKEVEETLAHENKAIKKVEEKAKMSWFTAFRLSSKNLYSKFKRTVMVALAGCIGIVGVSAVLAVSNGVQGYIADMENDMLSGNPVYITSSSLDYSSIMGGGLSSSESTVNKENSTAAIWISSLVQTLVNLNGVTSTNEIGKEYMDFLSKMPKEDCALIQYVYGDKISPNVYTNFKTSDGKTHKMSVAAIQATYVSVLENVEDLADYASMVSSVSVMSEMPSSADYISAQYDIVWMEEGYTLEQVLANEQSLVAVASQASNTLNDLELAEYGYFSQEQFLNYCYKIGNSDLYTDNDILNLPETISYERLASQKFTWYPNNTVFTQGDSDDELGDKYYASAYADGTLYNAAGVDSVYQRQAFGDVDGSVEMNVKCVLKLKSNLSYGCLSSGGLYYTNAMTKHMRDYNLDSDIVNSAKDNGGTLYNIELGYKFKFDGNTAETFETSDLSGSGSAIMSYISQFFGSSSSSKKLNSYSQAALGGAEYPATVYFYCNDFAQKQLLTDYLDVWNNNAETNLYKVDKNGFYVGEKENADGSKTLTYYYYDENSNKYYGINVSSQGYATDYRGNQYKLMEDETTGEKGFYLKLSDSIGEKFTLDGQIKLSDNISINAYTLAQYLILNEKFSDSNVYFSDIETFGKGDDLYRYKNANDEYEYVMKVKNQSYYKLALDKDGNVMSTQDGYQKYRYDETTNKFYKDEYVLVPTTPVADGEEAPAPTYKLVSTEVDEKDVSKLFAEDTVYSYPNVVKNPIYNINDTDYTIDTKGLYMDMTSIGNIDFNKLKVDTTNHIISFKDYSGIDFYYKDETDTGYSYYYVNYEEVTTTNKNGETTTTSYILGSNLSSYIDSNNLSGNNLSGYVSDRYIINDDGSLQAVSASYSDSALTAGQMLDLKVVGEELTDLSILQIDDSKKIKYTDMIGLIIAMVNTLINVITYALISFTALSLVVSTVMIGIITYVSVVERTKEIGVIRSLGGSKRDVSHLFNVETLIIGFAAGVLGILITYLLCGLINLIIGHFSGIYTIATLPWTQAVFMILLSMLLTSISGVLPARSAAAKDPVVALRTE